MDNNLLQDDQYVQFVGPFNDGDSYKVTVGGYVVPGVRAYLKPGTEDKEGLWCLSLSRFGDPFCLTEYVPEAWLKSVIPFMANAMAVSAGYTSFGENSRPMHPFDCKLIGI